MLVPIVEILFGLLLLAPGALGQLAAGTSLVLLAVFSVVAWESDGTQGCGCWAESSAGGDPEQERTSLLVRNAVLAAGVAFGIPVAVPFSVSVWIVGLAVGSLVGFCVMEIPQILAAATFVQSTRSSM